MDNVIFLRAFQTRLPRRLINDGWWLEERQPAATAGGRRFPPTSAQPLFFPP